MPMVRVELMEGRTDEQLREMVARVTDVMIETVNAKRESVQIQIVEIDDRHWAVGGERVADRTTTA